MKKLRERAETFLRSPLPHGECVKGNATLGLIARYVQGDPWDDPLVRRLAAGCADSLEDALPKAREEKRAFYAEAAAILRAILADTRGRN